ncbi:sigma-70 family RNA polymerase sigma factor [Evansella sp. AB-P1]|uniref:RNA polymerase sigma factor n=1 Tax=Evansella sp. AB-P1 TaxID=3037653 RepID=UPI00241BFBF0|nr:sigma-70 family RNA polymerase sigma factor [Evansella sp. AB-P1]MDG5790073.1 sigma-70 family RNA polymerase sigma factor [Evansella sp. AB-P1]
MANTEQVYKEYFLTVYKYLYCLTHDPHLAEELTQETFYQSLKTMKNFRGDCKISVWLCQIAKNVWIKDCQKRNRTSSLPMEEVILRIGSTETLENDVLKKEAKKELYLRIEELDENTKEVILLRIKGDLSFKEIGDILNRSETWARVTFYRGKRKLVRRDKN